MININSWPCPRCHTMQDGPECRICAAGWPGGDWILRTLIRYSPTSPAGYLHSLTNVIGSVTTTNVSWPDDKEPDDWYTQDAPYNVIETQRLIPADLPLGIRSTEIDRLLYCH